MIERVRLYYQLAQNHPDRRDDRDHWQLAGLLERVKKIRREKLRPINKLAANNQS